MVFRSLSSFLFWRLLNVNELKPTFLSKIIIQNSIYNFRKNRGLICYWLPRAPDIGCNNRNFFSEEFILENSLFSRSLVAGPKANLWGLWLSGPSWLRLKRYTWELFDGIINKKHKEIFCLAKMLYFGVLYLLYCTLLYCLYCTQLYCTCCNIHPFPFTSNILFYLRFKYLEFCVKYYFKQYTYLRQ